MTLHMDDITGKTKRRKYLNEPVKFGTLRFDSKKELRRWRELLILQRAKIITDLDRQVPFRIEVNGHHICTMIADFTYREHAKKVVEDVKSPRTRTIAAFRIKAKLLHAVHGLTVREV